MSIISFALIIVVSFIAGIEGILDEFQFHQPFPMEWKPDGRLDPQLLWV